MTLPIAFYAPMKSPNHPSPSGDRTMGRLLLKALSEAGFAPNIASHLRTWEPRGNGERQRALRDESFVEVGRLAAAVGAGREAERPALWFTYHSYYKAPDWLGPAAADRLGIPYVVAEATRAGKRVNGPWALAHAGAEQALDRAAAVFVMTSNDREALEGTLRPGQELVHLPPFVDAPGAALPGVARAPGPLRLLTVAMMRDGDKLASYRFLAAALARLGDASWTLDVVGDGEARDAVEGLFAFAEGRVTFLGAIHDRSRLAARYSAADLLVWPAVNEAYGMVLLEAQAEGCPVLAGRHGGVEAALRPGLTGVLTPPGDIAAFADALAGLIGAPARLGPMRAAAAQFVRSERTVASAAAILRGALSPLVASRLAA